MQFNPACLGAAAHNNNVAQSSEYIHNIPNNLAHNIPTNIQHNIHGNVHGNIQNVPQYTDPPQQQNGWSANVLNSLPFYGMYNQGLVTVPTTSPAEASPVNIPVVSSSMDPNKKKVTPKRMNELLPGEKPEDKAHAMDEEQKMKRQRRLLKNREAAQQFRQRQKDYIQNLERKVTELNTHVGETHKHIELLSTENRLLRDQLVYLYNVMRQNLSLSPTSSGPSPSFSPSSIASSPAPPPPLPPGTLDLGLLGFKGYSALESYEEMLKNANTPPSMSNQPSPAITPAHSPSITPAHSPSITPTPLTPRIIPELATLSIAKGMDNETCEMMNNPMLMGRFGAMIKTDHEVPELAIKTEGGGGNM